MLLAVVVVAELLDIAALLLALTSTEVAAVEVAELTLAALEAVMALLSFDTL
jgi:hypothetical protein